MSRQPGGSSPRAPLAGTDWPAPWGHRASFIWLFWRQILHRVIYPLQFHGCTLISSRSKIYSPCAAESKNKAISKQPPNPTGQVPHILSERNTQFAEGTLNQSAMLWMEFKKTPVFLSHTMCSLNKSTHIHSCTCPVALYRQVLRDLRALRTRN